MSKDKPKTKQLKTLKRSVYIALILSVFLALSPLLILKTEATSIHELHQKILQKKQEIENIQSKIESLEANIASKQRTVASLKNQIAILNAEIQKTENELEKTEKEIEVTNLEIKNVQLQIQEKELEIEKQKEILTEFILILYEYDQKNPIEVLLGYSSLSDFMDQIEYLVLLQNKTQIALDKLQELKKELEWKKVELNSKKEDLENLKNKLEKDKKRLETEKFGRDHLLKLTQEQEIQYQALLEEAKKEYQRINEEIAAAQREIQRRLEEARKRKQTAQGGPIKGPVSLIWPVDPSRGITAYFLDPSYQAYFGIPHYGIDIRCPQGTPVAAAADALVLKTRNAGYGYNYIMLLHNEELATVYGHITQILVSEGQYVKQGDIIGLSGGTPGTLGAGWLTTGPHLHFEVRVNGSPVDPLGYLP